MKLKDFKTEQWMNDYETAAVYNMTGTCVQPLSFGELIAMDNNTLENIKLDYGAITGNRDLKEKILSVYQKGTVDDITLFHGCLEANLHVMQALLEEGDTVITFVPGYQQFYDYPEMLGCHVIKVPLLEDNGWLPDMSMFHEAMQHNVKMIILNNPSNPTGTLYTRSVLQEMVNEADKQNTWILCDEVYQGFHGEECAISDIYEYGISTSSLSKVYGLAGLRLGWAKANATCIHALNVLRDYTMISTGPLMDQLANIGLSHKEELIQRGKMSVQTNKDTLQQWLSNRSKFSIVMPISGTVGFLKYEYDIPSDELAKNLLEETGVFFVPGSCFDCENHLRIGFQETSERFEEALNLLEAYCEKVETLKSE